ncbi:MAG TPA: thiolase family protein [Ilumatobacter sp.]|nr:thiolase family protein [Ilumatobacter sp.]
MSDSDVMIYGVGTSRFGKQAEHTSIDLGVAAILEAFDDGAVDEVDAVFIGTVYEPFGSGQRVLERLGIAGGPVVNVENACASGTIAFHEAYEAVARGRYDTVLALGLERLTARHTGGPLPPHLADVDGRTGLVQPARYATTAQRYMHVYGASAAEIASVAVKSSRNGARNDRAQHKRELSLDEVLESRMIADPLTLLQCCPISDGAAAAVVGRPRGRARDVRIAGSAFVSGNLWDYRTDQPGGVQIVERAAQLAYAAAGRRPAEIDVAEVHDAFTIGEIVTTEALGFAPYGKGAELAAAGETGIGGRIPVNPSGGLLARGHPLGATGLAQIAEITWQLRGEAGGRQVADASVGLVETAGGGIAGLDNNSCVVAILERGR